jgi:photosystem II stability/assembly factor-like uncharacterized protein
MKQKILGITAVLILIFSMAPAASAQWVQVDGPWLDPLVTCFAGSGENFFAGIFGVGVFEGVNAGETWFAVDSGLTNLNIRSLTKIGSILVAGTDSGIFQLSDTGIAWNAVNRGILRYSIRSLAQMDGILFAGTQSNGIFRSMDSGTSWTAADNGVGPATVECFTVLGSDIFAGADGYNVVYRSTDSGGTWSVVGTGVDIQVHALATVGTDLFEAPLLEATPSGVLRSTDSGKSWTIQKAGLTDLAIQAFAVSGGNLFAGTQGGIFLSTNRGLTWKQSSDDTWSATALAVNDGYLYAGTYYNFERRPLSDFGINATVVPLSSLSSILTSYPNPFTRSTTINFTTPESGAAQVNVVNLLGTEVARIFSGELGAGEHRFLWNATGLPEGMYECIVRMGGQIQRVPMVITR